MRLLLGFTKITSYGYMLRYLPYSAVFFHNSIDSEVYLLNIYM